MLSRIKLNPPEIRRALLELDDQKLTIDELKAMSRQLPTRDEASHCLLQELPILTQM